MCHTQYSIISNNINSYLRTYHAISGINNYTRHQGRGSSLCSNNCAVFRHELHGGALQRGKWGAELVKIIPQVSVGLWNQSRDTLRADKPVDVNCLDLNLDRKLRKWPDKIVTVVDEQLSRGLYVVWNCVKDNVF